MAVDFRDGKTFPRRGRKPLGRYLWLGRVIDKARAKAAGTIHDYIYPCPMDKGMLERWGVTPHEFEAALAQHAKDEGMVHWADARISDAQAHAANSWLAVDRFDSLNRQDREEGAFD